MNSFKTRENKNYDFTAYNLYKNNQAFTCSTQGDSPFSYHLSLINLIQEAIDNGNIAKYHFNLFRNILEKTSNFLGYNNWDVCIEGPNKQEFTRLLNFYSHSRLSDIENKELSYEDKNIFQETFETFIREYKWNKK